MAALAAAALLPAFVLIFSVAIRIAKFGTWPPSAGADWLVLLICFDIAVMQGSDQFRPLLHHNIQEWFTVLFSTAAFISALVWLLVALKFEPLLQPESSTDSVNASNYTSSTTNWFLRCRLCVFAVSWALALAMTGFQVYLFIYKP